MTEGTNITIMNPITYRHEELAKQFQHKILETIKMELEVLSYGVDNSYYYAEKLRVKIDDKSEIEIVLTTRK